MLHLTISSSLLSVFMPLSCVPCLALQTNGWLKSIHGQWVRVTLQGADVHIEAS